MADSETPIVATPPVPTEQNWEIEIAKARIAETAATITPEVAEAILDPTPLTPPAEVEIPAPSEEVTGVPDTERKLTATEVQELISLAEAPPQSQNPDDINDVSRYINILLGNVSDLISAMDGYSKMSEADLLKEMRNPASKIRLSNMMQSTTAQMKTPQYSYVAKVLADRISKLEQSAESAMSDKLFRGSKTTTGEIKGSAARLNVLARLGGLKRVNLLNSGFWVTIRPFTIAELHAFYQTVDTDNLDMGRHLGGVFFSFMDLNLKERFMEFFVSSVVTSNLEGWDKDTNLLDNISFQDYDICMWAVCSLIYKDGIEMTMFCAKPECGYRNPKFQIDLNKLRLNDYSIIDRAKMEEFLLRKSVTVKEVEVYRSQVQFTKELIYEDVTTHSKFKYTLKVPTISEHIKFGKTLLTQIVKFIGKETSLRNEQTRIQITINLYRLFIAWISRFDDVTNADAPWWTTETDAIMETLETSYHENTTFYQDLTAFIGATKISHIAYTGIKCPQCGAVVEQTAKLEDLVPVDVSALFFALACRQIEAMSKRD
jgi:hypothetical protein